MMANKMERFTQDARAVLSHAQVFAEELEHLLIEPEHVLLAMCKLKNYEMHELLADEGIILEKLLPFVKNRLAKGKPGINLDLSMATKKMLELSVDIVRKQGHTTIHSSHFLAAFVHLKYQGVEDILAHFQVEAKEITKALEAFWDEHPEKVGQIWAMHPSRRLPDSDIGCLEILRQSFGFGEKKKKR